MRIGIEAQEVLAKKKGDIDNPTFEVIKALQINDLENQYFIFIRKGFNDNTIKQTNNFKIVEIPSFSRFLWEQILLPFFATRYKLDILHCTSATMPFLYNGTKVLTVSNFNSMDKSTFSLFKVFSKIYRKYLSPLMVKKSRHIITFSEFEKQIICNNFSVNENKVSILPNPVEAQTEVNTQNSYFNNIKLMYNLPENYILYSVNNYSEKYFFNAILAYKNYCNRSFDNYKLVVVGVSEALIQSALEAADCSSIKSNIILIKESNKKDLHALYASASILLYPDLNHFLEIPLLKSLVKDIPIISTNDSALIEIAGDAATLINPMDAKNIGDAITYLSTDFSRKHKLINSDKEHNSKFNWNISAMKLIDIYTSKLSTI